MPRKWIRFCIPFVFVAGFAVAAERVRVAVPDFRNNTGKILRSSGSDMAAWMESELKNSKKFVPVDRFELNTITARANWNVNHFSQDVEAKIKELPADYVLYGEIQLYEVKNYIWPVPADEPQVPQIIVEYSVRMVDLNRNRPDQVVIARADELADPRMGIGAPPYDENDIGFDSVFRLASKWAMQKLAKKLTHH